MLDKLLCHLPATAGADFVPILSQKLTFNSRVTHVPLTLKITNDQIVEDTESFSAHLMLEDNSHRGVIELNPNSTDVTITDSSSEDHAWFKTKVTYLIYMNVKTLYATPSID